MAPRAPPDCNRFATQVKTLKQSALADSSRRPP
jgi:hypothetical protein